MRREDPMQHLRPHPDRSHSHNRDLPRAGGVSGVPAKSMIWAQVPS